MHSLKFTTLIKLESSQSCTAHVCDSDAGAYTHPSGVTACIATNVCGSSCPQLAVRSFHRDRNTSRRALGVQAMISRATPSLRTGATADSGAEQRNSVTDSLSSTDLPSPDPPACHAPHGQHQQGPSQWPPCSFDRGQCWYCTDLPPSSSSADVVLACARRDLLRNLDESKRSRNYRQHILSSIHSQPAAQADRHRWRTACGACLQLGLGSFEAARGLSRARLRLCPSWNETTTTQSRTSKWKGRRPLLVSNPQYEKIQQETPLQAPNHPGSGEQ